MTVIVEASSTIDWIVAMFHEHEIRVANPCKVRLIAESLNKTHRNDAHILLDLFKRSYMPESYISPDDVREARNICKNRYFLVRQRTSVKNRIRDQSFHLGNDFKGYTRKNLDILRNASQVLRILVEGLENINHHILEMDVQIDENSRKIDMQISLIQSPRLAAMALSH